MGGPEVDLTIYSPVCLPDLSVTSVHDFYAGRMASLQGWGDTSPNENRDYPEVLNELQNNLPITKGSTCGTMRLDNDQFCTGETGRKKTFCTGDSGGPATLQVSKGRYQQLGVVSSSKFCSRPFGAMTDVAVHNRWIRDTVTGQVYENARDECRCGKINHQSGHLPWNGFYRQPTTRNHICYAALVASRWAITSASCYHLTRYDFGRVWLSYIDNRNKKKWKSFPVEDIIPHPIFTTHDDLHRHNLALIKLVEHVNTTKFTPVCLPSQGQKFSPQQGVLTGWNRLSNRTWDSSGFKVNIVQRKWCQHKRRNDICAKSECNVTTVFDQHAPSLSVKTTDKQGWNRDTYTLVGIQHRRMRRRNCNNHGLQHEHFFQNVANFVDWIKRTMEDEGSFICK